MSAFDEIYEVEESVLNMVVEKFGSFSVKEIVEYICIMRKLTWIRNIMKLFHIIMQRI